MEENLNADSSVQKKTTKLDFEVEAMDYALKDIPVQNQTISFDQEESLLNKNVDKPNVPEIKKELPTAENSPSAPITPSSKELRSSLDKFPVPNPQPKSKKRSLTPILVAFLFLIIFVGGGFYYFKYFFNKKPSTAIQATPSPTAVIPSISPSQDIQPTITHPFSTQTETLVLTTENLSEKILTLKQAAIDNPALKESLKKGYFYQVEKEGIVFSAQELLQALDIALPIEVAGLTKEGWLFIYLDQRSILKTAIVLTVDETRYANTTFLNLEKDFPLLFKNLFVEEDSSVQESEITFLPSQEDARLRYFNFTKDDPSRTIDWAKIDNYLFFATSKETAFQLISLLEE